MSNTKHKLNVAWKAVECNQGKECWCRLIMTVDAPDDDDLDYCISPSGNLNKVVAEHIVKLHNKSLEK